MCRPGDGGSSQRIVYSGHKRIHCIMYLTVTTPHGLQFSMYGPVKYNRQYLTLLRESWWEQVLQEFLLTDGEQYSLYADSAFMWRPYLIVSFNKAHADTAKLHFNANMSAVHVAVEENYKDLKKK